MSSNGSDGGNRRCSKCCTSKITTLKEAKKWLREKVGMDAPQVLNSTRAKVARDFTR